MIATAKPLTVAAKCRECKTTEKTLRNWWELGCPRDATPEETIAWRDAYFGKRENPAEIDDDADESLSRQIAKAKLAKLNEEVREKSLNNAVREGELVSAEAVTRFLTSWVNCERAEMEGWANEIITELPGNIRELVFDLISERIRLKLLRLSEMPAELWMDEAVKDKDV